MNEIMLENIKQECNSERALRMKKLVCNLACTNIKSDMKRRRPKDSKERKILESFTRK